MTEKIYLKTERHPSGNWTLTQKTDQDKMKEDVFIDSDTISFFEKVGKHIDQLEAEQKWTIYLNKEELISKIVVSESN